jgi:hypothetical protein
MSPRPAEITVWAPSPPSRSLQQREVFGFLVRGQVATPSRPYIGSLHVRACGFAPAPFRPLVAETPRASALNFNDQSTGRTFTSLPAKLPVVPQHSRPRGAAVLTGTTGFAQKPCPNLSTQMACSKLTEKLEPAPVVFNLPALAIRTLSLAFTVLTCSGLSNPR